jgi:predicted RNA binding protein YcfA (HicA-like mRNA interferase family)
VKTISGKELCRILEQHGWVLRRVHGSHHIYGRDGDVTRLSVPVHGNKPLKIGLQHHILKLAGILDPIV